MTPLAVDPTGNSTNNLEATICQHTLRKKVLRNIELVNKNYHLEKNLHEMQGKMASILAQNQLLQKQLLVFNQLPSHSAFLMAPNNGASDKEDVPMSIHGGGVTSHPQFPFRSDSSILLAAISTSLMEPALLVIEDTGRPGSNFPGVKGDLLVVIGTGDRAKEKPVQTSTSLELACHTLHLFGEVHVPYPPSSEFHKGSYYSCPGWMTANDMIHPVPGFDPASQKQVLCSIWRPRLMTFRTVLDTVPQGTPDCPKVPRQLTFCSEEIVDVDGR
jgi:hypothetical protein